MKLSIPNEPSTLYMFHFAVGELANRISAVDKAVPNRFIRRQKLVKDEYYWMLESLFITLDAPKV